MCKKQATARVDATFETQQNFSLFRRNLATCQLAMGANAQVTIENEKGLTYGLRVTADCQCDGMLKLLHFGIDKAIGTPPDKKAVRRVTLDETKSPNWRSLRVTQRQGDGFSLKMTECGLPVKQAAASKALKDAAQQTIDATAIDSQLTYVMKDATPEQVEAYAMLNLYAQGAARSDLADAGVDITKTDYLNTKQWFDAIITQMQDLGFTAKNASGGDVKQETHSGTVNLGEILTTIVGTYLGVAELESFKNLANLLSKDPNDVGTHDFLSFWWNHAETHDSRTTVAFGPIKNDQGLAAVTCVYLVLDVDFKDWQSLFVSYHSESLVIHSFAITLDLDLEAYRMVEDDVKEAVGEQMHNHIKHQKLKF
ncbi:hypothetical protein CDL60_18010 [Roseateles noduli]|nr:hypothetical protein CDL60_18010 [Roseateles noduli]